MVPFAYHGQRDVGGTWFRFVREVNVNVEVVNGAFGIFQVWFFSESVRVWVSPAA